MFLLCLMVGILIPVGTACGVEDPDHTYISDCELLVNSTNQILVTSTKDNCYLYNVSSNEQTSVSCNDYPSSMIQDWYDSDTDPSNTYINSVNFTSPASDGIIEIEISRNDESLTIYYNASNQNYQNSNFV